MKLGLNHKLMTPRRRLCMAALRPNHLSPRENLEAGLCSAAIVKEED